MSFLSVIGSLFSSRTVEGVIDLAKEKIEDVDKSNNLIVDILKIEAQRDAVSTIPIVDGIHKMGRQLLWYAVIGFYVYAKTHGIPVDLDELALLCSGPGLYTLLKGRGR